MGNFVHPERFGQMSKPQHAMSTRAGCECILASPCFEVCRKVTGCPVRPALRLSFHLHQGYFKLYARTPYCHFVPLLSTHFSPCLNPIFSTAGCRQSCHVSAVVQAKKNLPMSVSTLPGGQRWQKARDVADVTLKTECQTWVGNVKLPRKMEDFFLATSVWPRFPNEDRAMSKFQGSHGLFALHALSKNKLPFSVQRPGALGAPARPSLLAPFASNYACLLCVAVLSTALATTEADHGSKPA